MSDSVVSFDGKQSSLTWPYNCCSGTLFNTTSPDASLAVVMQLWLRPSKTCLNLTSWKIYCNKISDPKQQTETSRSYTKKQYTVLVYLYCNLTNFIKITENHCTRPAQILGHGSFSCNYQLRGWAKLKAPRSRGPTSQLLRPTVVSSNQRKPPTKPSRPSWGLP